MLCYQSSRAVTDIVRDSFQWLVANRHIFVMLLAPFVVGSTLAVIIIGQRFMSDPLKDGGFFILDSWPYMYSSTDMVSLAYAIIGFFVSFSLSPLLRCYFVDRRSVRTLSYERYVGLVGGNILRSLAVGALSAFAAFIVVMAEWFASLVVAAVYLYMVPLVIMGKKFALPSSKGLLKAVLTFLSLWVMTIIIRAIPVLIVGVVGYVLDMVHSSADIGWLMQALAPEKLVTEISLLNAFALCLVFSVYLTAAVLLHGAIYPPAKVS